MPKIDSLYELIKKASQEKGRKIKVIADWDDVIQAFKPVAVYELRKLPKFKDKIDKNFPRFLERFWEISITGGSLISDGKIKGVEDATELERELFDEYTKMVNLRRGGLTDYEKSFYSSPEWISTTTNAPLLSPTKDLLKALKEDLIEKLIIISSYRKGREKGQGVTRKN